MGLESGLLPSGFSRKPSSALSVSHASYHILALITGVIHVTWQGVQIIVIIMQAQL